MRVDGSLSGAPVRSTITRLVVLISLALSGVLAGPGMTPAAAQQTAPAPQIWAVPEVGALPNDAFGQMVRRGRDLITATYAHVGPEVADPAKRFAGNNLACANCHLDAGTKKFGIPLFGLFWMFPEYTARGGSEITLEDRLNACMTRSMNGRPMPNDSPEMQAIVAYIKFLSTGVAPGEVLSGLGVGRMPELDRAADPVRGKTVYATACLACHNTDGSG
ncbi:MAG TPA: cystathionine gamma-synthase, partial [Xanthobacteraceae bacterium]|nr:cystathionine gamma-synthase [Xanthobacteraceae bacterium]